MVEIKLAQIGENRQIVSMLNHATLDMMEKGIRQWPYPWSATTVKQQIGLQKRYLLTESSKAIGSFTFNSSDHYENFIFPTRSLILSEIILVPEIQGLGYSDYIFEYCTQQAMENQLSLYLASPVKNSRLERLFLKHDFELWDRTPGTYLYRCC